MKVMVVNNKCMYVKGRLLNLDGLEKTSWYFKLSSAQADQIKKGVVKNKSKLVAVVSDRGKRLRIAQLECNILHRLPQYGRVAGSLILVCRQLTGDFTSVVDIIKSIPTHEQNRILEQLIYLYLPERE